MAHTSSNCLYFDQHNTDYRTNRVYEFAEVDQETRQKDCKICLYSLGLLCSVFLLIVMSFNVFDFTSTDIESNHWSSIVRYTLFFILFILTSLFIYGIAKILNYRKPTNTSHNSQKDYREY